jgi:hypothetical protein
LLQRPPGVEDIAVVPLALREQPPRLRQRLPRLFHLHIGPLFLLDRLIALQAPLLLRDPGPVAVGQCVAVGPPGRLQRPAADRRRRQRQQNRRRRQGRQRRPPPHPLGQALQRPYRPRSDRLAGLEAPQVLGQLGGGGVALARLLPQTFQTDRFQIGRRRRLQPPRPHRLVLPHLPQRVQGRRRPERGPAGEALVEDRPQRVDVRRRPRCPALAAGLLGGHVARRAQDGPGGGLAGRVELLGQAEIGDLGHGVGERGA